MITYLTPMDGAIFPYGDFVDLTGNYILKNSEPNSTYTFGWKVYRTIDTLDLSLDAFKTYYGGELFKVHLDKNVILPNYFYTITFYVQGHANTYKDFYVEKTHSIYIGTPPKPGLCTPSKTTGYPVIQTFAFYSTNWLDANEISIYRFYYSYDGGKIYIPLQNKLGGESNSTIAVMFNPIYKDTRAIIKCEVLNNVMFSGSLTTNVYLMRRDVEDPV